RGINGSGVRGINGSGVRGINGSGVRGRGYESAAIGPVEAIEITGQTAVLRIAGQTYIASADVAGSFSLGDYVVAASEAGGAADVLYLVGEQYVPGASTVLVVGPIGAVQTSLGNIAIGDVVVDYSAHLAAEPTYLPQAGDVVEVEGIQPVPGDRIIVGPGDEAVVTQSSVEGKGLHTVSGVRR
ncbi:MAG TPA: hypothetical protein VJA26_13920, partial [Gammaproteobacteria bacterium]|nr:hypothetical protein [Gammaproteobacteria bacterium]